MFAQPPASRAQPSSLAVSRLTVYLHDDSVYTVQSHHFIYSIRALHTMNEWISYLPYVHGHGHVVSYAFFGTCMNRASLRDSFVRHCAHNAQDGHRAHRAGEAELRLERAKP